MKLKFMLVPLAVLGFVVGSYADCSKDEILKFLDKGYSKTEVDGICGKNESKKEELTWITPSDKICKANGGEIGKHGCKAEWLKAEDICHASGGELPTIEELKKLVADCGGINTTYDDKDWYSVTDKNIANKSYQACYKEKGLSPNLYWSSSTIKGYEYNAWVLFFYYGGVYGYNKGHNHYVSCVRDGQ